ncbi:flavodoxin [Ammoniphilus oxalaticus]|uniref:Flavodoxin n=1 Tax=Ammoniphilus oxalaticus TaxID=66863 RepID=A0A419SEZ1_9BACL|nr:flavodoxin [Ammoniphilus oxalaticus]
MPKLLIVYASLSGNTEEIASVIAAGIHEDGFEVDMKEVESVTPEELLEYDGILLGSYTWGDGELPDEYIEFYEGLDALDLSEKKAAVFGSGDTSYEHFCGGVDVLEEKLTELGAELTLEGLRVEFAPDGDEEEEKCKQFGKDFVTSLFAVTA